MTMANKNNPVSPKLKHGKAGEVGAGLIITVLIQAESSFGQFAGDWTPTVYLGAVIAAGAGIGYLKRDPLRVPKLVKRWTTRNES